jgi:hypothetical protein
VRDAGGELERRHGPVRVVQSLERLAVEDALGGVDHDGDVEQGAPEPVRRGGAEERPPGGREERWRGGGIG